MTRKCCACGAACRFVLCADCYALTQEQPLPVQQTVRDYDGYYVVCGEERLS